MLIYIQKLIGKESMKVNIFIQVKNLNEMLTIITTQVRICLE